MTVLEKNNTKTYDNVLRHTWAEINLDCINHNLKEIKRLLKKDVNIFAVVKADAYGLGAVEIAEELYNSKVDYLAVATLTEALQLRQHNEHYPIFILGHTPDKYLNIAVKNNITLTIFTLQQALILCDIGKALNKTPKIHIKCNTGLNRLGFGNSTSDFNEIVQITKLDGIFSHFAICGDDFDKEQFNNFISIVENLKHLGISFKYIHICDGINAIDNPQYHLSAIRPGAALYGAKMFINPDIDIRSSVKLITKISQIRSIKKGERVGYLNKWIADRDCIIGTIPIGYADGFPASLGNKGTVTVKGIKDPILGHICMDQCMIDLSDIPDPCTNDEVIIFYDGKNNTNSLKEFAVAAETGPSGILCCLSQRIPRVYFKNGKIVKIRNPLLEK